MPGIKNQCPSAGLLACIVTLPIPAMNYAQYPASTCGPSCIFTASGRQISYSYEEALSLMPYSCYDCQCRFYNYYSSYFSTHPKCVFGLTNNFLCLFDICTTSSAPFAGLPSPVLLAGLPFAGMPSPIPFAGLPFAGMPSPVLFAGMPSPLPFAGLPSLETLVELSDGGEEYLNSKLTNLLF